MTYSKRFSSKFFSKLLQPGSLILRETEASSLEIVFEELDKKKTKDFFIVETGYMRPDHGHLTFGDDGGFYIWDDFVNYYDGDVISVDINQVNVDYANANTSDKTQVYCQDSVEYLWGLSQEKD